MGLFTNHGPLKLPYVRIPYLSYIRVAACFAIIILHTFSAAEIIFRDQLTQGQEMASTMLVYVSMWAVPCFIMVTGVLQLNPERELTMKELFGTFIWRIVAALILCCVIFQLFDLLMDGETLNAANILQAFVKLFLGTSWAHLWYLYMLIGLYLFLPFFRLITKHGSDALIKYLLIVCLFFISVLPLTQLLGEDVRSAFIIPLTTIYPVYLFLGYAIHHGIWKIGKPLAITMIVASALLTIAGTWYKVFHDQDLPGIVVGSYASLIVVVLSCGVFALFRDWTLPDALDRVMYDLDRCSFGIYLFHMIFIRLVLRYWKFNPYEYGAWAFVVLILAFFVISYALVKILKLIPGINKII
ncbi:MAG: acyltransferase [Anaerovoracaceae bacterium]